MNRSTIYYSILLRTGEGNPVLFLNRVRIIASSGAAVRGCICHIPPRTEPRSTRLVKYSDVAE